MGERYVEVGAVTLWTDHYGETSGHPTLLIMGATAQGIAWSEAYVDRLVAGGLQVVLFDHRDTGKSTLVDFETHPYGLQDLADDAFGILDAYGFESAHIVGCSMGGMVAQVMAIRHPERVRSMVNIMSSPSGPEAFGAPGNDEAARALDLPHMSDDAAAMLASFEGAAPTNRREAMTAALDNAMFGGGPLLTQEFLMERNARYWDRARDLGAAYNHMEVVRTAPSRVTGLRALDVPTLAIHGELDPYVHPDHSVALVNLIPDARLLRVARMGHDLPDPCADEITTAIVEHVQRAEH